MIDWLEKEEISMDEYMDKDVSKVIDSVKQGTSEDGFFFDDFEDLGFEEENSMKMDSRKVDFEQFFTDDSLSVSELKDIIRETVLEVVGQIDIKKINYLVDVLGGNTGILKHREEMKKGKTAPAKKRVPDIEIEMDYMDGMSCLQIARKWGFTEDGVRKRLQRLGIYKGDGRNTNS
ncbi:hypothetical protein KQI61_19160 [Anaerocolumna aminovalerica]|uniref:hypothetical protein n=1 Tax=Anaerocolumna aminovalerica TaxID=1527 RepID=UPI001C0F1D2E|nr:hypothetical protein [Anaerocolumna aminovalerica]MBU5334303.1 hypothetical protein [Anaerocolumna aminovalerica]